MAKLNRLYAVIFISVLSCTQTEINDKSISLETLASIESKLGISNVHNELVNLSLTERLEIIDSVLNNELNLQKRAFLSFETGTVSVSGIYRANAVVASYNLKNQPIMELYYDNEMDTVLFNEKYEAFILNLKPYTKGINRYEGRIIEGEYVYEFEGGFMAN